MVVDRAASVLHFLQDNCKKYSLGPSLPCRRNKSQSIAACTPSIHPDQWAPSRRRCRQRSAREDTCEPFVECNSIEYRFHS